MPLQPIVRRVKRSLYFPPSVGSRLFLSVLGITLFGLGSTSYLLYRDLEKRSAETIQLQLLAEVEGMNTEIHAAEQLMVAASSGYRSLNRQGLRDLEGYKALALDLFKTRSSPQVIRGLGFGGGGAIAPAPGARPGARTPWPYFFPHDPGDAEPLGLLLPAPHGGIRYSDVCALEDCVQQDYYRKPIAAGKAIWLDAYAWHGIQFTTITEPIYDDRQQLIGLTGIDLSLTDLTKKLDRPVVAGHGYFTLLSASGNVLAHPSLLENQTETLTYQKLTELKDVWAQITSGGRRGLLHHQGHYLAYQRMPGPNWVMVAIVPEFTVVKPVLLIVGGSAIAVGGLLGVVLWLFTQRLSRRLRPMLVTCRQMAQLEDSGGDGDELDVLARAFQGMTQQLQASFRALGEANQELERRVDLRTVELSQALQDLQQAQSQLVQSEKMSSLGQLVAGIAHEVNNPITFIHGNLKHARDAMQVLVETIELYQQHYPAVHPEIATHGEDHDLAFVMADLPSLFESMKNGTTRVQTIVQSLRNFSRLDESGYKAVDLHEGLESTLLILHHRLNPQGRTTIQVVKRYGDLPEVRCYPGQINQVFLNILTNAIEALEKQAQGDRILEIQTEAIGNQVAIAITNNGPRIPPDIAHRLFDPFFTTKPVGQGTGMGLAVSYQVVEHHGGQLSLDPTADTTCFRIQLPIECRNLSESSHQPATAVQVR